MKHLSGTTLQHLVQHLAAATALVLFISTSSSAQDIIGPIEANDLVVESWVPPSTESDEGFFPLDTVVGKMITFMWTEADGPQDVWIHPTGDCTTEGSIFVGPTTSGDTKATYTFMESDGSMIGNNVFFTSQIDNHCSDGQQISIRIFSTQQDFEVVQSGGVAAPGTDGQVTPDEDEAGEEEGAADTSGVKQSFKSTNHALYLPVFIMVAAIGFVHKVMV
jgi:hypothetical protein